MSPVFILSRLCLNRRFQFFGIVVPFPVSAFKTLVTISSSITLRSPTLSAFSVGTLTVMSLCRILIVRYSRFCPRTLRDSFLTTVPAPWCGYTTLSPTLYKPSLPFVALSPERRRPHVRRRRSRVYRTRALKGHVFQGFSALREKPLLRAATTAAEASLAMPTEGRTGFAGAAVLPTQDRGMAGRAATRLRPRHRLRCRLEAVPALPVRPSYQRRTEAWPAELRPDYGRGIACDADWRPYRLCRCGRPTNAGQRHGRPSCDQITAEASLAMPTGGCTGFAGAAVLPDAGEGMAGRAAATTARHRLRCRLSADGGTSARAVTRAGDTYRRGCVPAAAAGPPESRGREPCRHRRPPRGRAARRARSLPSHRGRRPAAGSGSPGFAECATARGSRAARPHSRAGSSSPGSRALPTVRTRAAAGTEAVRAPRGPRPRARRHLRRGSRRRWPPSRQAP